VAAIASIEIPRKEWLDIVPNLCNNAAHDEAYIRQASLQTLGFICEELEPRDLEDNLKSLVVQALTRNITPDPNADTLALLAS
jgi:importin subunit beta-1